MTSEGHLFVPPGSPIRRFAETIAWLWRLGPVADSPNSKAVGIGWLEEGRELHALVRARTLAAAAIFAPRPGPDIGAVPSRQRLSGVADFGPGRRVSGQFSIIHGGHPAVRSSIGVHAVRDQRWMVLAADPNTSWGALDSFWMLPALVDFLVDVLDRPIVMLPPVGWVRYDDVPGTAQQQLTGRTKTDRRVRRRVNRLIDRYQAVGAKLNVAVCARALVDGKEVPTDDVWPEATATLAEGIERGVLEPVCHGYLHLDTEALRHGEVEPREFTRLGSEESGRRLDVSLEWSRDSLGALPRTFIAPTWGYGPGLLEALAERRLPAWLPPEPGPLISGNNPRETLLSTLEGLYRLDYGPFAQLAEAGLPPTLVIHGGLFDGRLQSLRPPRDIVPLARLAGRRDLFRVPWVEGVRWVGAGELLDHLRGHEMIEVAGSEVRLPAGARARIRDRAGVRAASG